MFDEGFYTAPKAVAHPGGAPVRKRSSSKKKKPRAPKAKAPKKARTPKPKPPCKYGPRDENGRCPKKPKAQRKDKQPQVKELKSVDGAARQAGEVLRSSKATHSQKKAAVRVLGQAVAAEAGKKVVEHTAREATKAVRQNREQVVKAAKAAAKAVGTSAALRMGVGGAAIAGTLYVGGKVLDANRAREAKRFADDAIKAVKKTTKLTKEQEQQLWQQHFDYKAKQSPTNSYSGK